MKYKFKMPITKGGMIFFFLYLLLIVIFFLSAFGQVKFFSKERVAKFYGVDKRKLFETDKRKGLGWIILYRVKIQNIKERKKLTLFEVLKIFKDIGNPYFFPIFAKKDLIKLTGCRKGVFDYHLKKEFKKRERLFRGAKKFPPSFSADILRHYEVNKEEIENYFKKKGEILPIFFKY